MISLFGYGKTIQALSKNIYPCNIYDDKFINASKDEYGNNLLPLKDFNANTSTLEIVSPGIPPHWELIKKAKNLISDYDYIYAKNHNFSIWISGTNGKTTTTQMTQVLLKDFGSQSGGNIGTPICELSTTSPIWILETSSFTMHYTNSAKPDIYALLPITQDHISWHKSFKKYQKAKLKPLTMMDKKSIAIIPAKYKNQTKNFKGKLYFYNNESDLAKLFNINLEKLKFKGVFLLDCVMALAIRKLALDLLGNSKSLRNLESPNKFESLEYEIINSFNIGAHKLEEFLDSKGRIFVDDSKATNTDAVLKALQNYKNKNIFLILGGDSKGVSLEPLIKKLVKYHIKVFAIGMSAEHICKLCKKYNIYYQYSKDLKTALQIIKKKLSNNEVCILSPACSSLDQFTSYVQRGEEFKKYALEI